MVRVYQKLVRDEIPRIIRESGKEPVTRTLTREETLAALAQKLSEEAQEYRDSGELEELADVMEVIRGIVKERGVSMAEVEAIRARKAAQRGGFEARVFLEEVRDAER